MSGLYAYTQHNDINILPAQIENINWQKAKSKSKDMIVK